MKKTGLILAALLCSMIGWAQSYGILVNGKIYYAADYRGPDGNGEGFEEYLAHVQVSNGDYCQLYDYDNKAAWAKPLNSYSVAGFAYDESNQRYTVTTDGCFDFYIKLKFNADELYIGPAGAGVACGEGVDISKGEQLIVADALQQHLPVILLQKEPITSPYRKPPRSRFEACTDGLLLIIAPTIASQAGDYQGVNATTDYAIFHNLNLWAESIADEQLPCTIHRING